MNHLIFTLSLILFFSFAAFAQNNQLGCATIEVTGGGVVKAGDAMSFTAKVEGMSKTILLEYEWQVSQGTISSGQGTPSITVDTTGLTDGTNIKAEVKIKGLYDNCANTASETGSVTKIYGDPFDRFGKLSDNEVKARIQNLYVSLEENPNSQGYIINYGTDKEIANRERQIRRAINFLKLNANHVTIVRGSENKNGTGVWTIVWIVPPGAEFPQP
jgi:hypothetical protein